MREEDFVYGGFELREGLVEGERFCVCGGGGEEREDGGDGHGEGGCGEEEQDGGEGEGAGEGASRWGRKGGGGEDCSEVVSWCTLPRQLQLKERGVQGEELTRIDLGYSGRSAGLGPAMGWFGGCAVWNGGARSGGWAGGWR